jgi:hypothetical protein
MRIQRALGAALLAAGIALVVTSCSADDAPPHQAPVAAPSQQTGKGVLGPFNVHDAQGVTIDHYAITGDSGSAWNPGDWPKRLLLFCTQGLFALVRLVIGAVCWLLDWGFSFSPAQGLMGPADTVAQAYQTHVVDPLGLPELFLLLAGAWCGVMILRGRTSRGAGELGISLIISALAAVTLAHPADLLLSPDHGLLSTTRDTAMALASITSSGGASDNPDPGRAADPLTRALVTTFVTKPNELLNYGEVLDDRSPNDPCLQAYREIVKDNLWNAEEATPNLPQPGGVNLSVPISSAHTKMEANGCAELAKYSKDPSWDKLLGAAFLLGACVLVGLLVFLMVGVLLMAIVALAFYAMYGTIAAIIAILPGGPRAVLWRWFGGVTKVILVIFAVVICIPLLTLFIDAMMTASKGEPMVVRFLLVDVVAAAGLVFHRKLTSFGKRAGYRIARRMEMARTGGSRGAGGFGGGGGGYGMGYGGYGTGWLGHGDPNGLSPVSLSATMRGARAEVHGVLDPIVAGGRRVRQAWQGSPDAARKATKKLPADAGKLRRKMAESRGGRTLWRAGKAASVGGKFGLTYSVGLPVSAPRLAGKAQNVAALARQSPAYATAKAVGLARTPQVGAARAYGRQWARNIGVTRAAADLGQAFTSGAEAASRTKIVQWAADRSFAGLDAVSRDAIQARDTASDWAIDKIAQGADKVIDTSQRAVGAVEQGIGKAGSYTAATGKQAAQMLRDKLDALKNKGTKGGP